ncbi:hypothetical protein BCV70DRAFT_160104 [Testicularia cyperi]|uniref:Uncharacterized protein n=1 Tax=Testicularia cyperi TaxID=1882483 RepID=A0A317XR84_9BASI|nr:hypothetical protein BCV70DRAFT_160104 [Testicularia cyperi]
MRALFSTLGRRNGAGHPSDSSTDGFSSQSSADIHYSGKVASAYADGVAFVPSQDHGSSNDAQHQHRLRPRRSQPDAQPSFRSLDAMSKGIGDVPAPASQTSTSRISDHIKSATSGKSGSNWKSRLSGSIRNMADLSHSDQALAPSQNTTPRVTATHDHPPSSYRGPLAATTSALGLNYAARRSSDQLSSGPSTQPPPTTLSRSGSGRSGTSDQAKRTITPKLAGMRYPPSSSRSHSRRMSTMDSGELASKLNELAVANADGLLSDEEYRVLRQAVFDRMLALDKGAMQVPTTTNLAGRSAVTRVQPQSPDREGFATGSATASAEAAASSQNLLSASHPDSKSSLSQGDNSAVGSIRSEKSNRSSTLEQVNGLFKRGPNAAQHLGPAASMQRKVSQDSRPNLRSGSSEQESTSSHGRRLTAPRRDSEPHSVSPVPFDIGDEQHRKPGSVRTNHSFAGRSTRASTFGRIRASSNVRRIQTEVAARDMESSVSAERTARSLRSVSIHDSTPPFFSSCDDATSLARAEGASSAMFGTEYTDRTPAEIKAEMAVVQAEGDRILDTFAALEQTLLSKHAGLDPVQIRSVVEEARASNALARVTRITVPDTNHAPSSFRNIRTQVSGAVSPSTTITVLGSNGAANGLSTDSTEASLAKLRNELFDLAQKRSAVVKRYNDRLAFLQSKFRAASLREGLKS